MTYQLATRGVIRLSDNLPITRDMAEWEEYRQWLKMGGVPEPMPAIPPTPPTPEEIEAAYRASIPVAVTMRQARLALLGAGVLATADAAIAGMPGIEGEAARIEWEFAHEVRRDAPLVAGMASVLGLTALQLDTLFVTAAGL